MGNRTSSRGSLREAQPLLVTIHPLSLEGEGWGEGGKNTLLSRSLRGAQPLLDNTNSLPLEGEG